MVTSTPETCPGDMNGTATVVAMAGQPPYTYQWSNGGNTATITGLTAGTYTVTVTDSQGCSAIDAVTVMGTPPIVIQINSTDVLCAGEATGMAMAMVNGRNSSLHLSMVQWR